MQNIISGSKNNESLDEILSQEKFLQLISLANSLKQAEEDKIKAGTFFEKEKNISISVAYKIAEELWGISKDNFDKARAIYCPPIELQLKQIQEHSAKPTFNSIFDTYSEILGTKLKSYLPSVYSQKNRFFSSNSATPYYELHEIQSLSFFRAKDEGKRGLFSRIKKFLETKTPPMIARLKFEHKGESVKHDYPVDIDLFIRDPVFLSICGEEVKLLREFFKGYIGKYNVSYDYIVK